MLHVLCGQTQSWYFLRLDRLVIKEQNKRMGTITFPSRPINGFPNVDTSNKAHEVRMVFVCGVAQQLVLPHRAAPCRQEQKLDFRFCRNWRHVSEVEFLHIHLPLGVVLSSCACGSHVKMTSFDLGVCFHTVRFRSCFIPL